MKMPKKLTTNQFIENAKHVHGNKYNYSLVEYKRTNNKVRILCSTHGEFLVTPNDHVSKSSGCPVCSNRKKHTTEEFIENAKTIHGTKYDYSLTVYTNVHTPVKIICPEHGVFEQLASSHVLRKAGCEKCSYVYRGNKHKKSQEQFIAEAQQVHNHKYDYSQVTYSGTHTKVNIGCSSHGNFKQRPLNHLHGQGCPECKREKARLTSKGGYTQTYFETFPERRDIPAELYLIHVHRKTDNYLKIGITTRDTETRFATTELCKGDYDTLKTVKCSLYNTFTTEQRILRELKDQQYWPNYLHGGKTECFKFNKPNIQKIQTLMETVIS